MFNLLVAIFVVVLILLVAFLWYGVRTHKTVAELKKKASDEIAELKAKSGK